MIRRSATGLQTPYKQRQAHDRSRFQLDRGNAAVRIAKTLTRSLGLPLPSRIQANASLISSRIRLVPAGQPMDLPASGEQETF